MMVAEKRSEASYILNQVVGNKLFPEVNEYELERVLFFLSQYPLMKMRMHDYEQYEQDLNETAIEGEVSRRISNEEYYANKTANTVILREKRLWVYERYSWMTKQIDRSYNLIIDKDIQKAEEEKKAIRHRYLEGHSRSTMFSFFPRGISQRTIERRLHSAIIKMANNLKCNGVLEVEWKF